MSVLECISEKSIVFTDKKDKYAVINALIDKAIELGSISDKDEFKKAIEARESLISTGIGLGVAVPHAKLDGIKDFFIIVGITANPVQWDSIDQQPVNLVFLIGGPSDQQNRYLKLLSQIIMTIKDDSKRDVMVKTKDVKTVLRQFQG